MWHPINCCFSSDSLGLEAKKEENLADWYSQVSSATKKFFHLKVTFVHSQHNPFLNSNVSFPTAGHHQGRDD